MTKTDPNTTQKKMVMIVDALNMYFRAYIRDPSLSTNGQPIGGVKGFFKILQKLLREHNPDKVVICWDGAGGSRKRRATVKDYKAGRKPIRLNRDIHNLTENEEVENKIWQQTRLVEYLNCLPTVQLVLDDVEADDIISYLCRNHPSFVGWNKLIISNDKDFLQLCDTETVLYRPAKKEAMNIPRVLSEYNIHPENFALARAIAGDPSDNLRGIPGVGLSTVAKRIPMLKESQSVTIDEVIDYCENIDSKDTAYGKIAEGRDTIELNYKMMQLYSPSISIQGKNTVDNAINNCEYALNKTEFIKMTIEDGFGVSNWNTLFQVMNKISFDFGNNRGAQ